MCLKNGICVKKWLVFLLLTGNIFAQKARQVLKNVSDTMYQKEHIYLKFDYVLQNKATSVHQKIYGEVYLKKNKYYIQFMQNTLINDGRKIYNINTEDKEINVMNPAELTEQEDQMLLNPRAFLKIYKKKYEYQWYRKKDKRLKKYQYIQAVPQDKNQEIAYVLIGLDLRKKLVRHLISVYKNATQIDLYIKKIRTNEIFSAQRFVFDKQTYEQQDYIINE